MNSHSDVPSKVHNSYCTARQMTIPATLQAALLVSSEGAGLMRIETLHSVAERQCYMTVQDQIDVLLGKHLRPHPNLTSRLIKVLKFMIVVSAWNVSTRIIHEKDDQLPKRKDEGLILV